MFCGASLQKLLPWQSLGVKLRKFIVGQVGFCKEFAKLQERGSVIMTLPRVLCGEGGISRRGVR